MESVVKPEGWVKHGFTALCSGPPSRSLFHRVTTQRAERVALQDGPEFSAPRARALVRDETSFGIASADSARIAIVLRDAADAARSRRRFAGPLGLKSGRENRHFVEPSPARA